MRSQCRIEGCDRDTYWKSSGVCRTHSNYRTDKICTIEDCEMGQLSKQLCRNHYEYNRRTPTYRLGQRKCKSIICNKDISTRYKYCVRCRERIDAGIDPDSEKKMGAPKGSLNWRWNGGVAEYKNHGLMKRLRKQKIEELKGACEECLTVIEPTRRLNIHHVDRNKENHEWDNLRLLCRPCHMEEHKDDGNVGKPAFKFNGYTIREIADLVGCSYESARKHLKGTRKLKKLGGQIDVLTHP